MGKIQPTPPIGRRDTISIMFTGPRGARDPAANRPYAGWMAEPKTTMNQDSVADFLAGVADPQRRADATDLCELIREVTGAEPAMWGTSIVGFGSYHYVYASGREGDWPAVGLSPRKQNLTVYLSDGIDRYTDRLAELGRHTTGKSCLYLRRLSDVDSDVLRSLVRDSFNRLNGSTITNAAPAS